MTAPIAERDGRHELLRLATAGSVDDGKSTLLGRLLLDTQLLLSDQLAEVSRGRDGAPDLAALTDGLRPSANRGSPSTSPIATSPPSQPP